MEEFPSNAHRQNAREEPRKPEPKKVERVTQGEVVRRKKPLGRRFREVFVGGDAKGVGSYVLLDVLIPAAKDTIADALSQGVERMLFGESRAPFRRGSRSGANGYVHYNRYSSSSIRDARREDPRNVSRRARANFDFDEIILETRVEAEEVIDRLFDLLSKYDVATVADLYDLVGVDGTHVDRKWGWTDIRGAGVTRIRNGYLLDLPRPEPLD